MISEHIHKQIIHLAEQYPEIENVRLFGSRAHGDETMLSDIDLIVRAPHLSQRDWLGFLDGLDELDTLLKIDVVRWETASDALKKEVEGCFRTLYTKGERLDENDTFE